MMLSPLPIATPEELEHKYLTFFLGRESYGIPVGCVREIFLAPEVKTEPHQAGPPRGTATLRGRTVPVVDLRRRFLFPEETQGRDSYVIVAETGQSKGARSLLGVMVDDVETVAEVSADDPGTVLLDIDRIARGEDDADWLRQDD